MKVVVVGGASTYTPELIDGFVRMHSQLPITDLVLVDPDERRLEIVSGVSRRIVKHTGDSFRVSAFTDLNEAIPGADVVLIQLRVGGQIARVNDETLSLDLGLIGQETTGVGGLAKALRTVPVVLDIATRVKELAPDAWIVNFTNPVGIVTRALLDAGHRAVGLCNVAIGLQHFFAGLLDGEPSEVTLEHVGLNHLSWELEVSHRGVPVLQKLIATNSKAIGERVKLPYQLIEHLRTVPSYYLRFYYQHGEVLAEQLAGSVRAKEVLELEHKLLELYQDPNVISKPDILGQRGGALYSEAAVQLITSLLGLNPGRHVVNVRNYGLLSFLPDDAVIEISAEVGSGAINPVEPIGVPTEISGLIADVSNYEYMALQAALKPTRQRIVSALLSHPLIRDWCKSEEIADRIIVHNRNYFEVAP